MTHLVKCGGEIFRIPGGHLKTVMRKLGEYKERGQDIDYGQIKGLLMAEMIADQIGMVPAREQAERTGYLDFDSMQEGGSDAPVPVGDFYKANMPAMRRLLIET